MPHLSTGMDKLIHTPMKEALGTNILYPRLLGEQVATVNNTINNWDKCMLQSNCKWPTIVGLIIGVVVVLSIITCVARCMCCGYSFCCSCFSCLNCCGCCKGKRSRRIKQKDSPSSNYRSQGYNAPPPMMAHGSTFTQYARFDTNKANSGTMNEDSLPAMPSWDTAKKVHVLDEELEENHVELQQMSSVGQKEPLIKSAAAIGLSSPKIQEGYMSSPIQDRPSPGMNNGYRTPLELSQQRAPDILGGPYSPGLNPGNRIRRSPVAYGSLSTSPVERPYGSPPMQNMYNQIKPSTPNFAKSRYGSSGPAINMPGREYGRLQQNQRDMTGYQGYRV